MRSSSPSLLSLDFESHYCINNLSSLPLLYQHLLTLRKMDKVSCLPFHLVVELIFYSFSIITPEVWSEMSSKGPVLKDWTLTTVLLSYSGIFKGGCREEVKSLGYPLKGRVGLHPLPPGSHEVRSPSCSMVPCDVCAIRAPNCRINNYRWES